MFHLSIVPDFDFKLRQKEAGDYFIVLPINVQGMDTNLIILRMWCSSLRWAIQDAYCDLESDLNNLFGIDNWEILFNKRVGIEENSQLNVQEYQKIREQYKLPIWEEDKEDMYQFNLIHKRFNMPCWSSGTDTRLSL